MEELTAKQDEYINDERQQEAINDHADDYFLSWFSDNKHDLRIEFCSENEDEFMKFARIAFNEYMETKQ